MALGAWLKLVRWPNLLIVAMTQFVAWWCVIYPLQGPVVLTPLNFSLLCLSTVLIAAGGYIINDYFDVRIDVINKPDKVILERDIPRKQAIIMHSVLNVLALVLAVLVALPAGHPEWLLLQIGCTLLLWRYSTTWKRQFMIGNVVVALMTALTILALFLYESALGFGEGRQLSATASSDAWLQALTLEAFALFAFLLTWMREVVKDMEDFKGDDAEGCVTMPIRLGLMRSTRFVQGLALLCIALLVYCAAMLWKFDSTSIVPALYLVLLVAVPLGIWSFRLGNHVTSKHYHRASTHLKWIMVLGILTLPILKLSHHA